MVSGLMVLREDDALVPHQIMPRCCEKQNDSWDVGELNAGTPEVETDIVHMGAHTLGVRTCKWATYAASRRKLGQHLNRHREFNCPLSCGLYLEGSVKEKWHRGTIQ